MTKKMRIAVAQANPTVGNIDGNLKMIQQYYKDASDKKADLVIFPELVLCGYPPEDLILNPFFLEKIEEALEKAIKFTSNESTGLLLTLPYREDGKTYNAALLLAEGEIKGKYLKMTLPNYGVFDEQRVFTAGRQTNLINFKGIYIGVPICEDIWVPDVCQSMKAAGADLLIVPNGSPFEANKLFLRRQIVGQRVSEVELPLIYVNQIGGQDDLVFDGDTFVVNYDGSIAIQAMPFATSLILTDWELVNGKWYCNPQDNSPLLHNIEANYLALVTGLRDYVQKNNFPGVLLGMSGGIDSALTAAIAVDALGPQNVRCIMMPSPYTSQESITDARLACKYLGVSLEQIDIEKSMTCFEKLLSPLVGGNLTGITAENIQSRIRGLLLMAISNSSGYLLLSTGNKSEVAVGYTTLYGDMCGGFSVLKDVYKTQVYSLSLFRNSYPLSKDLELKGPPGMVIPDSIILKAPSAELRPDQTDQDTLPPYEVLDTILEALIEKQLFPAQIEQFGYEHATIKYIWQLIDKSEYKRRQSPLGIKITRRAFERERRIPVTNGFHPFECAHSPKI